MEFKPCFLYDLKAYKRTISDRFVILRIYTETLTTELVILSEYVSTSGYVTTQFCKK